MCVCVCVCVCVFANVYMYVCILPVMFSFINSCNLHIYSKQKRFINLFP